jgi:hypothetical protein
MRLDPPGTPATVGRKIHTYVPFCELYLMQYISDIVKVKSKAIPVTGREGP